MKWCPLVSLLLFAIPTQAGPLEFEFRGDLTPEQQAKLQHWLEESAQTLALVSGEFPLERARITITPTRRGYGPVPWARVVRRQPEGIHFYVDPTYPPESYRQDWTALHEFSHLLIPYPGDDDIWFSEGLASYYQNLLRGRAGIVTPEQALKELDAGFQRGERDAARRRQTLRELSPRMWRTGSYMRVYWSGAAYFFSVDTALRQELGISLDTVLARFIECCRQSYRRWSASSLIRTFDHLAGGQQFDQHYRQVIDSRSFPDLSGPYQRLGLSRQGRRLTLDPAPSAVAARQALFTGSGATP
ncbi:hypothetical protein [Ferrimonas balearica]|uniref:M61 family metallopeptidase n=1 Tax=Ferrimonas balearica TaxID=44012 RepID=UPI001C9A0569|nr:hypothetical protein [Ferrimonas balearica]MBY5922269.1 hypothetical protein [Ferrimonas balearica]MBY5994391.1 hypothetical protein [Ferrimonas balearica]